MQNKGLAKAAEITIPKCLGDFMQLVVLVATARTEVIWDGMRNLCGKCTEAMCMGFASWLACRTPPTSLIPSIQSIMCIVRYGFRQVPSPRCRLGTSLNPNLHVGASLRVSMYKLTEFVCIFVIWLLMVPNGLEHLSYFSFAVFRCWYSNTFYICLCLRLKVRYY